MAQAVIDWESSKNCILLNPRMPVEDKEKITKQLLAFDLSGHIWLTTSGTTGRYKCVALSKEAFLVSASAVNKHFHLGKTDSWVHCLPDFHVGGLSIHARAYLSGSKVHRLSNWNPQDFFQVVHNSRATVSSMVPAQLYDVLQMGRHAPDSYRTTIIGGGKLAEDLFENSWKLGWNAVSTYGMTECASQVAVAVPGTNDCYKPLEHIKIKVDRTNKILIKSSSLLTGYAFPATNNFHWEDPKKEGWFESEDKGVIHHDLLEVYGRDSDIIKINGELVNLSQLQLKIDSLRRNLNLKQSLVLIPVPHPRSGFNLHGATERLDSQIEKLRDDYNAAVIPFERIVKIHEVDSIPYTSLGKTKLSVLREKIPVYFGKVF